jgi:hypothetical protein
MLCLPKPLSTHARRQSNTATDQHICATIAYISADINLVLSSCSMCLFVQNQNFQRHTEFVLNLLYTAGAAAAQRLVALNASMAAHSDALEGVGGQLTAVVQQQVPVG